MGRELFRTSRALSGPRQRRGVAYGYFSIDKHGQLHKPSNATICSKVDAAAYKRHLFHLLTY